MFRLSTTLALLASLILVAPVIAKSPPVTIKKTPPKLTAKQQDKKRKRLRAGYHFNKGEEYRAQKQWDKAIEEYKKAIKDDPEDVGYYKNLGAAYAKIGKLKEAASTLRQGTKVDPKDWLVWNNLAVVLNVSGQKQECIKALKIALTLHPPDSEAAKMKTTLGVLEKSTSKGSKEKKKG